MKEMWERPRILVEEFAPNDYVAACFNLGCKAGASGDNMPSDDYSAYDLWNEYSEYELKNVGSNRNPDWKNVVVVGDNTYYVDTNHSGDCSYAENNAIQVNGSTVSIWENNSQQGTLDTLITLKEDRNNDGIWNGGDLFAWITFGKTDGKNDGRIWLHWAFAGVVNALHPNRS